MQTYRCTTTTFLVNEITTLQKFQGTIRKYIRFQDVNYCFLAAEQYISYIAAKNQDPFSLLILNFLKTSLR